jgi:CTP synthase (UTP-ammonia lyase)
MGDYDETNVYHDATNEAIRHAARKMKADVKVEWVPTEAIADAGPDILESFDALWAAPGSPYRSEAGALLGIRYARETGRPLVGT